MKCQSNIILSSYLSTPEENILAYILKITWLKHLPEYLIESRKCILYTEACKMKLTFSFHTHSVNNHANIWLFLEMFLPENTVAGAFLETGYKKNVITAMVLF